MDSRDTRGFSLNVVTPICEESSRPWNIHRNVMGKSPWTTLHWTVMGSPDVIVPWPKLNGITCGATTSMHICYCHMIDIVYVGQRDICLYVFATEHFAFILYLYWKCQWIRGLLYLKNHFTFSHFSIQNSFVCLRHKTLSSRGFAEQRKQGLGSWEIA